MILISSLYDALVLLVIFKKCFLEGIQPFKKCRIKNGSYCYLIFSINLEILHFLQMHILF